MNNLADNLINHIYDYSIGDKKIEIKFKNVIDEITYFNADDIVSEYFSNNNVRPKELDINIINCWLYLDDNKFKQYIINNVLHILKYDNHQFYNEIQYYLIV